MFTLIKGLVLILVSKRRRIEEGFEKKNSEEIQLVHQSEPATKRC